MNINIVVPIIAAFLLGCASYITHFAIVNGHPQDMKGNVITSKVMALLACISLSLTPLTTYMRNKNDLTACLVMISCAWFACYLLEKDSWQQNVIKFIAVFFACIAVILLLPGLLTIFF